MEHSIKSLGVAPLLSIGGARLTLLSIASAIVIVLVAVVFARVASRFLERLRRRSKTGGSALYVVEKLVTYGILIVGAMMALQTVGLNLSSLAVFAGAIGVGVGLGLQGVVREFVSGLVLIFDDALHIGDFIELNERVRGEVISIGARATHIRTNDQVDILVPNSKLIDGDITNWTLRGATRRIHVKFSVAYGVDKARVRDAVLEAARAVPFTLPDDGKRKTQVWMTGFGDSSLNFELVVWPKLDAVKRPASMNAAYVWAIEDALRNADIEMPFPQMDLRLRSLFGQEGDDALRTLKLEEAGEAEPAARKLPTRNDAAEDTVEPPTDPVQAEAQAEAAEPVKEPAE
ncbi:MAG: mechanosensitive ion channel [Caulobacteraceae bacterium]|nr:mechanosensitive ion channel [Caulobacter sp.]